MKLDPRGPFDRLELDHFLHDARVPLRLAAVSPSGRPMLLSLWYQWAEDSFWCATPATARIATVLAERSDCAFEVSLETPPYAGVRGQGHAELLPDGKSLLRDLLVRYGGDTESDFGRWLLGRDTPETMIRIRPDRLTSWDFSERMRGAFVNSEPSACEIPPACISSQAPVAR